MKSSAKILVIILIGIFLVQNISLIIAQGPPTPEAVNKFENGPPFPETELCLDSDYGNNPEVGGLVAYNQKDFKDFCSGNILTEYFCSNQNSKGPPTPESTNFGISNRTYNCASYCQNKYGSDYKGVCSLSFEGFGFCNCTLAIPVKNEKDPNKYSKKNAFLISDKNWREILSLVPLTTWTSEKDSEWCQKGYGTPSKVCVYPTLIYHRERESFDADSIIYFFQQYKPDNLTIIGNTPPELDNLLIVKPELGAGLKEEQIKKISFNDYFSYWKSFNSIVVVDYDNYANGLMGSVWASLKNIPIIFVNSNNLENYKNVIDNRKIYIIGKIDSSVSDYINKNAKSSISYTLEELQKEYIEETNTDKIILVNPNDLDIAVTESFTPEKSSSSISELYSKTSLVAPILAGAKQEVIISTTSTDYEEIDNFIENKIGNLGINPEYLTIIGAPNSIPYREFVYKLGNYRFYRSLDQTQYSNLQEGGGAPDIPAGRIMGITISDVSSNIVRNLFYKDLKKTKNMKFMASSFSYMLSQANRWSGKFTDAGYNASCHTETSSCYKFSADEWKNNHLISYQDHGGSSWAGISYSSIPLLNNSIVFSDACSTCSTYNKYSFCNRIIRQGALAYLGAVSVAWIGNTIYMDTMNGIYYENLTIGQAFKQGYLYESQIYTTILIGDPTLHIDPPYLLSKPLKYY